MYIDFSSPTQIVALVIAAMVIAVSIPVRLNPGNSTRRHK
jgi:hypothetical protein